jgi:hypothetical protein
MFGTYVKTAGSSGLAKLKIYDNLGHKEEIEFVVRREDNENG